MVTRLDGLARSTRDLLDIAEKLKEAGAGLRSLAEPWADTTSPAGRMVLTVFAGIAEFERELIHQRTSSGRVAAKARGVRLGRPPKLTPDQSALGEQLVSEGTSVREAAKLLKCHHATLYRALTAAALAPLCQPLRSPTRRRGRPDADPSRACVPIPDRLAPALAPCALRAGKGRLRALRAASCTESIPSAGRSLVGPEAALLAQRPRSTRATSDREHSTARCPDPGNTGLCAPQP